MSTQNEHPQHDEAADEELSESLEGHDELSKDHDDDEASPLEEIEDSPVRTKNS